MSGGEGPTVVTRAGEDDSAELEPSFGRRLRRARMRRRWTQLQLAKRMQDAAVDRGGTAELGSLKTMISKWEIGMKIPNDFNRRLLAEALGVTVADLGLTQDPDFFW